MNNLTNYIQNIKYYDFFHSYILIFAIVVFVIGFGFCIYFMKKERDKKFPSKILSICIGLLLFWGVCFGIQAYGMTFYLEGKVEEEFGGHLTEHIKYLEEHNKVVGEITYDLEFDKKKDSYQMVFFMSVNNNQNLDTNNKYLPKELADSIVYEIEMKSEGVVKE